MLALVFATSLGSAQGTPRPPEELLKMRRDFAEAIVAGNADVAAKLAHFPLAVPTSRGAGTVSRAEFLKRFKAVFAKQAEIVDCWQNHNLVMEYRNGVSNFRIWHLDCGTAIYDFTIFDGRWLLAGYRMDR
jgi:hypothetical protein